VKLSALVVNVIAAGIELAAHGQRTDAHDSNQRRQYGGSFSMQGRQFYGCHACAICKDGKPYVT